MKGVSNDCVFNAIMTHDNNLVKDWIRDGGDVNLESESGNTLLMNAMYYKNDEIARFLLYSKADVDKISGSSDWTTTHWAAAMCNRNYFLNLLLQHGSSMRSLDNSLHTPLHVAVSYHNRESVHTLLDAKASLSVVDLEGCTPLDISQRNNDSLIQDMLLKAQSKHAKARAIAIVFMAVAKRHIHKDLVRPIGWMIWESRNLNIWLNATDE